MHRLYRGTGLKLRERMASVVMMTGRALVAGIDHPDQRGHRKTHAGAQQRDEVNT